MIETADQECLKAVCQPEQCFDTACKGTDLSVYSQEELDKIADSLNTRPRKTLDWRTPLEVYAEVLKKSVEGPSILQ
jgi:hypothetical protein